MKDQIPSKWGTQNLLLEDATQVEVAELQAVYDNCSYIGDWTGADGGGENYMQEEFDKRHLPPEGVSELHRLQSIKLKADGEIIGYAVLYHGFPDEKTLWIAILAIHTDHQGKQFGKEFTEGLIAETKKLQGYNRLGLTVGIKNWPALRFWINNGFTNVLKLNGDKVHSEKTFADLWLTQDLWKS